MVTAAKYVKPAAKKVVKIIKAAVSKAKATTVSEKAIAAENKSKNLRKIIKAATERLKNLKPPCFTAGTKIYTEKGFKAIENIKPGDYVWSENPETNEKALKKVKKIFVREKDSVIRLAINGEAIETTDEHSLPFCPKSDSDSQGKTDSRERRRSESE